MKEIEDPRTPKPGTGRKARATKSRLRPPPATELANDATERAFRTFLEAVGKETTRANELALQARKALFDTIEGWLESMDDAMRAEIFTSIEAVATAANARRIRHHPLRPDIPEEVPTEAAKNPAPTRDAGLDPTDIDLSV